MATGYILVDAPNPNTGQGTFPRRGGAVLTGTCIVHTSEGNWQAGVQSLTNLVRSRSDYGCYHRACDWEDIALYYPWEWECWQDSETNNWAAGIAAACKTTDWLTMPEHIREGYYRNLGIMAADFVTYMRDQYGITVPLRRITGAEARARVPGFAAHGDSGVSRSDPGPAFDWAKFFAYTAQALTGTLNYASESITPLEEEDMPLSKEDVEWIVGRVTEEAQKIANVDREYIPGAVWKQKIDWRNPATGELVRGATTPETVLSYMDTNTSRVLDAKSIAAGIPEELVQGVAELLAARMEGK